MTDIAVISWHEKGFWQADLYRDFNLDHDDAEPDAFRTFAKGGDQQDAVEWVKDNWPEAEMRFDSGDDESDTPLPYQPWTACEECANTCGGGEDFLECGMDLGDPYGGGVTFICDSFQQEAAS